MNKKVTPAPAHYGIIRQALEHGKHVYTEKTLTDDIDRSGELVRLAREKGLYLGSAPDTFLGSALQTARSAIDSGLLGEILFRQTGITISFPSQQGAGDTSVRTGHGHSQ